MATFIPSFDEVLRCVRTEGERLFAKLLNSKLDDSYYCWYEVPVGDKRQHTDFVILHPAHGLLILEVKDWKDSTLVHLGLRQAILEVGTRLTHDNNPVTHARNLVFQAANSLEEDLNLISSAGRYQGKLVFPYAYGAVLTNLSRETLVEREMLSVLPDPHVICKDDMDESISSDEFEAKLLDMFMFPMKEPLTELQMNCIRGRLFPEIRMCKQKNLFDEEEENSQNAIMTVMDYAQEQLARALADGHRVVHGPAGSGKTVILLYRARYLAMNRNQKILVLCFSNPLAQQLNQIIFEKEDADNITVKTFHQWCYQLLKDNHISIPDSDEDQFHQNCVDLVIKAMGERDISPHQYDAILIDEGQDFKADWFKVAVQMVKPKTDSLFVLYDDAQAIFKKENFTFSSVGIKARGRTTILKYNYRNTREIIEVAKEFARDLLCKKNEHQNEDQVCIIEPKSKGDSGDLPILIKQRNRHRECVYIAETLLAHYHSGIPWHEMCVVYRCNYFADQLKDICSGRGIPIKGGEEQDGIHLLTMHRSKGLEFTLVCILAVGESPTQETTFDEEVCLMYVAMTRAIKHLVMTYSQNSLLVEKLHAAIEATKEAY